MTYTLSQGCLQADSTNEISRVTARATNFQAIRIKVSAKPRAPASQSLHAHRPHHKLGILPYDSWSHIYASSQLNSHDLQSTISCTTSIIEPRTTRGPRSTVSAERFLKSRVHQSPRWLLNKLQMPLCWSSPRAL